MHRTSRGTSGQAVAERIDPRVTRTAEACERAVVELASDRPISQITVADLAGRAGVTRATFYNHYNSPLELLIRVLLRDLERAQHLDAERRAQRRFTAAQMLRFANADVAEHIERYRALYQNAAIDPADGAVFEALVRHFADYALDFIARCTHPDSPEANHQVIAQFLAHGFAGAIKAWVSDDTLTAADFVDATGASAPIWWT